MAGENENLQKPTFKAFQDFGLNLELRDLSAIDSSVLDKHRVVFIYDNHGFAARESLVGDMLQDYVSRGGNVVIALFAFSRYHLSGKFVAVEDGLCPLKPDPQSTDFLSVCIIVRCVACPDSDYSPKLVCPWSHVTGSRPILLLQVHFS